MHARCCQTQTRRPEDQKGARAMTSGGNNNDVDNQGGDMPSWMFKEESNRGELRLETQSSTPAQTKKNDNRATQDVKVQEGKCVAGPCLTMALAKKTDKIRPLKVKGAMSSIDKTAIEDLQKKYSTLKKCFDRVGKPIIRDNYFGEFFTKMDYFIRNIKRRKREEDQTSKLYPRDLTTGYVCEQRISI